MNTEIKILKPGDLIFFIGEKLPMKIMAKSERFAIASRKLDKTEDADALKFEVKRGSFLRFEDAYKFYKNEPIYTIIDFKENIKGASNLIFGDTDFFSESSCDELIKELEDEDSRTEISHRNRVKLNIDWMKCSE